MAKPAGRPTKLDEKRSAEIVKGISAGLPYDTACALAGICYQTFANWMRAGEEAESGIYFVFFEEVKKAEAIAESLHIRNIKTAGNNGVWQADAWLLERRYPLKWGRKDQVKQEITGKDGSAFTLNLIRTDFKTDEPDT